MNEEIIALLEENNQLLAQQNANMLFVIGVGSALIVIFLLWKAIKKFI